VPRAQCKPAADTPAARRAGPVALQVRWVRVAGRGLWVVGFAGLLALNACSNRAPIRTVRLHTLEAAAPLHSQARARVIVSDAARLAGIYHPLGERLGLIQVRTAAQWARLAALAPGLGTCPDLKSGAVVGVASRVGLPLDGHWPVHVQAVRGYEGAGYLVADFNGGSYLPDTTTYLETVYVPDLAAVLVVEVNGVRFYPK
jgi:hypothetical protein